ncbi:hypothetical protein, partial [Saccharolobus sp.]|uniref:hypothetical protein n=1 Tax=Saccharolobus sp. TaxID=2100761 RepID=UPI003181EC49
MYRYVSYLEIEKLRQFLQEISNNIKIEQISIPEEKLKEADFIEPVQETLERIKELSNEMIKNRIFSQINRYLNDLLTQNKVYSLDGPISYISKRKLEDLLINFSIDYENNRYKNASFLKKYGDELDLILQNLGAD